DDGRGFDIAWAKLTDREAFWADFGPTTVERRDPMFLLQKSCCWWSGQSWPYATTQTLKGLANLLQTRPTTAVSRDDYLKLLQIYSRTHRKDGKPYLAEAAHPDTGSFEGHDGYNHSEHYFHSGFTDLVITGLVGVRPEPAGRVRLHPLAPADWSHFALDSLPLGGHRVTIAWDRDGSRYGRGQGLRVLVNGQLVARSDTLQPLEFPLPAPPAPEPLAAPVEVNYAVNNDGTYFPRVAATHVGPGTTLDRSREGLGGGGGREREFERLQGV
ncbi:MAG: MGH1-like glycoside hydrolase domain-containing protein, partial [Planctomycetaceae bacterium]